jgi:hypothetical protein
MYDIQHCFICRPSDATVSEDAGIVLLNVLWEHLQRCILRAERGWLQINRFQVVTRMQLTHTWLSNGAHCYGKVFILCFLFMRFLLINSRGDCASKRRTLSRAKPISWRP